MDLPRPLLPVGSLSLVAFDIAVRNILSLWILGFSNLCTAGLAGALMVGGNGYQFVVAAKAVGAGIWCFAPLEVLSFCVAGGASMNASLSAAACLFSGKRSSAVAVRSFLVAGIALGAACVGLTVAAVIEAAVLVFMRA